MTTVPIEHALMLAAALFCVGLAGVLIRRNVLFMLMSIEIMLNAAGLAFVVAGTRWQQADGQVMFLFAQMPDELARRGFIVDNDTVHRLMDFKYASICSRIASKPSESAGSSRRRPSS